MPVLDELATQAATAGIGTVGTTIFKGILPDTPDACVALIETGGMESGHTMSGGAGSASIERPTVEVIARGAPGDYATPRTKAKDAFNALDGITNTTLSSVRYFSVRAIQSPFLIGRDANDRVLIGFNLQIEKVPS